MSPTPIEYITSECPNGHRVRGDIGWLNREVCCPHCKTEFTFKRPDGTAVEVIAPDGSKLKKRSNVSDTSVMKILGDFADAATKDDGTTRHCRECGATYPSYVVNCYNCNVPLGKLGGDTEDAADGSQETAAEHIDFQPISPFPFEDVTVRNVMRPRKEIQFLDVGDSLAELLQEARKTRHTRYVVCDCSLDKVAGLVHIEDIVLADENTFDIKDVLRPIELILESTPVSETLLRLQKAGEPIALIVDEFDTVIGMTTVKDVMLKLLKKG
ncbi:CBS domain-containing protein [Planctomycetes bacterium K23_9]|uniref:Hemolysin C n=1 Tax=Stieleria marina TaxID=1930275 RepID=A0A517NYE3_9BACT|nr:Hemolysin C [Planctomycetes bacterium K23_9]